ncbi:MAG: hypothetical protein WB475_03895 [Pseudolabrys sp.]
MKKADKTSKILQLRQLYADAPQFAKTRWHVDGPRSANLRALVSEISVVRLS